MSTTYLHVHDYLMSINWALDQIFISFMFYYDCCFFKMITIFSLFYDLLLLAIY